MTAPITGFALTRNFVKAAWTDREQDHIRKLWEYSRAQQDKDFAEALRIRTEVQEELNRLWTLLRDLEKPNHD